MTGYKKPANYPKRHLDHDRCRTCHKDGNCLHQSYDGVENCPTIQRHEEGNEPTLKGG